MNLKRMAKRTLLTAITALFLVATLLYGLSSMSQPQLSVEAAPLEGGYLNSCFSANVLTQTTNGPTIGNVGVYKSAEIYVDVDATAGQTLTFKIQISPDGTVWYDHPTLAAKEITADDTSVITSSLVTYGKYNRCVATIAGSGAGFTGTVKIIYRDDRTAAEAR